MPSSKHLTSYPDWFMTLANDFESGVDTRTYILPDHKSALRLRQQLYGFLRALRRDNVLTQYPRFQTVRIIVAENELTLQHVDNFIPQPPIKETPHEKE